MKFYINQRGFPLSKFHKSKKNFIYYIRIKMTHPIRYWKKFKLFSDLRWHCRNAKISTLVHSEPCTSAPTVQDLTIIMPSKKQKNSIEVLLPLLLVFFDIVASHSEVAVLNITRLEDGDTFFITGKIHYKIHPRNGFIYNITQGPMTCPTWNGMLIRRKFKIWHEFIIFWLNIYDFNVRFNRWRMWGDTMYGNIWGHSFERSAPGCCAPLQLSVPP